MVLVYDQEKYIYVGLFDTFLDHCSHQILHRSLCKVVPLVNNIHLDNFSKGSDYGFFPNFFCIHPKDAFTGRPFHWHRDRSRLCTLLFTFPVGIESPHIYQVHLFIRPCYFWYRLFTLPVSLRYLAIVKCHVYSRD